MMADRPLSAQEGPAVRRARIAAAAVLALRRIFGFLDSVHQELRGRRRGSVSASAVPHESDLHPRLPF